MTDSLDNIRLEMRCARKMGARIKYDDIEIWEARLAALSASHGVVVPVEPTEAMLNSGHRAIMHIAGISSVEIAAVHRALLAAAPKVSGNAGITPEWQQGYDAGFNDGRYTEQKIARQNTTLYCAQVQNEPQIIPESITPQANPAPPYPPAFVDHFAIPAPSVACPRMCMDFCNAAEVEADHARIVAEKDLEIDHQTKCAGEWEARAEALAGVLAEALQSFRCTQRPGDYPQNFWCNKAIALVAGRKGSLTW